MQCSVDEPDGLFTDLGAFAARTSHFKTPRSAVDHLIKLGRPPMAFSYTEIPEKVDSALQALAALAGHMKGMSGCGGAVAAAVQLKTKWDTSISKWTQFFLRDILLSTEGPLTPHGVDIFERLHLLIPYLLLPYHNHWKIEDLMNLARSSFFLPPLLSQFWRISIFKNLPSKGLWCELMWTFVQLPSLIPDMSRDSYDRLSIQPARIPVSFLTTHDEDEDPIALAFIRHLNYEAARLPEMTIRELQGLGVFVSCLVGPFLSERSNPLFNRRVRYHLIAAWVNMTRALFRRKVDPDASLDTEENRALFPLLVSALARILYASDEPWFICESLKAGIVMTLLKTPKWVFRYDKTCGSLGFSMTASFVLHRISQYLVYPLVLNSAVRLVNLKVITAEGLEERLKSNSDVLYDCWGRFKDRLLIFHHLRPHAKKLRGLRPLCDYAKCPLKIGNIMMDPKNVPTVRYRLCSSCLNPTYCSSACQKQHWKESHREKCGKATKKRLAEGVLGTSRYDLDLCLAFAMAYISEFSDRVESLVERHRAGLTTLLEEKSKDSRRVSPELIQDCKDILMRRKNPVLVIFLDKPEISPSSPEDCIKVYDSITLTEDTTYFEAEYTVQMSTLWRHISSNVQHIMIITRIPGGGNNTLYAPHLLTIVNGGTGFKGPFFGTTLMKLPEY
ncbi:hypothetical protein V5O48_006024 [Marasmius crinis-equi]|uniref:MYND-type domain-containing protein n=1 Tax=Marasmius crinis-equi TaxID=585013 RepID=A0ABR3FL65_9AGAR